MSEQILLEKDTVSDVGTGIGETTENAGIVISEKKAEEASVPKVQKNYGIELLRIVSMFLIVILHVIGFGGISYFSAQSLPGGTEILPHYKAMNIMLAFCYCAVNCYALISGYVGCKSKFKPSKIISLWLTVVSINAALYGCAYLYNPEWVAAYNFKNIFYPLTNDQYWYFTCYIGLLVIMPALNAAVNNIPKKQYRNMLIGMFVFFSVITMYSHKDLFKTVSGYSMLWLVLLYLVGAYFRLHFNPQKKIPLLKTGCALIYILSALAMAFTRFHKETALLKDGAEYTLYANDYQYNSVFVVICSVALFVLFVNINIKNKILVKIIGFVSATTFGVYLIHLNYIVVDKVITGRFGALTTQKPAEMVLGILAVSALIFLVCAVLEKVRQLIFKLLFIDKLMSKLDKLPARKSNG